MGLPPALWELQCHVAAGSCAPLHANRVVHLLCLKHWALSVLDQLHALRSICTATMLLRYDGSVRRIARERGLLHQAWFRIQGALDFDLGVRDHCCTAALLRYSLPVCPTRLRLPSIHPIALH